MWAYNGFNDLGDLGEEIPQPHKNIPSAILIGLFTVGALYITANITYLRAFRSRRSHSRNTSLRMRFNRSRGHEEHSGSRWRWRFLRWAHYTS